MTTRWGSARDANALSPRRGIPSTWPKTGRSASKGLKEKSYDLILMDLMMPGIGGLDLIKKVHDIDPEIIVVVITGYATIETAVEATKRGGLRLLAETLHPGSPGRPGEERAGEAGTPARGPKTPS